MSFEVLVLLVVLALAFDFMNGFHDAANSIATVVSTRVLRPQWAVAWAAFFNFVAYFLFELKVASTIGKGTIDPAIVDHHVVFGALVGAIVWNLITWWYGIPSSSSHALIGGLVGAALAKSGIERAGGERARQDASRSSSFRRRSASLLGTLLMIAVSWIVQANDAAARRSTGSGACSSPRRRCTASATAATTRRRRSASSGCC